MFENLFKTKAKYWFPLIALLVFGNLVVWILVFNKEENNLRISFYDVGQGDAALIQTPSGYNILVDGGPNNKVSDYLNRDLPITNRELDLVILTHPQSDHMYGLIEVLKNFKVRKVVTSNSSNTTSDYKLWIDTVNNADLKPEFVKAGESISIEDNLTLEFNWPESNEPLKPADLNEASLVFTLSYFDFDVLMTGDADSKIQPYRGIDKSIEILKVPHHGSATSMTDEFITNLKPTVSIISVGSGNRYSHPRVETLQQLEKVKSKVFRTDQNGTIKIVSQDGKWYTQAEK